MFRAFVVFMIALILHLFLGTDALAQAPSQKPAAPPTQAGPSPAPSAKSTGDIDMNQFDNLKPKKTAIESGLKVQVTCTTPQGTLIKKGERGFDTCVSNSQSPVMNQPRTTEKENDPREQ